MFVQCSTSRKRQIRDVTKNRGPKKHRKKVHVKRCSTNLQNYKGKQQQQKHRILYLYVSVYYILLVVLKLMLMNCLGSQKKRWMRLFATK